ncbi:MAG: protein kinase [Vicinamibacterales bacterium]
MALNPGTRLGVYEVSAQIGAGGMGQVFRALDTRLNRDVALKVLPDSFAHDAERVARFTREAQTLASLNHPNIAHIHGLEESGGVMALVMELVEGEDLSQRITRGAVPLAEALLIAKQIAEALEAAHEQGIIHRDLKPANIKLRPDGTVKVLDFGLAKAINPAGSSNVQAMDSPTLSMQATAAGVILGTAAYMAPEQARGKVVDRRADIWAWGCVLFEMLTGTRAFRGDDVTDTMVAVLSKEPEWPALPASAVGAKPLLARCLQKDPRQRLQAIGDARICIDELIAGPAVDLRPKVLSRTLGRRRGAVALAAATAAGASIAALATWTLTRPAPLVPLTPTRIEMAVPSAQPLAIHGSDRDIAISSDGRQIAYRTLTHLMVRSLDRLETRALEEVPSLRQPFFSPDGQWIGFFDGEGLKKVPSAGGRVTTVHLTQNVPRGASWGTDNTITFATYDENTGLMRVPASGGEATALTTPDVTKGERDHWYPSNLPGGRGVLFTLAAANQPEKAQIAVLDSRTGQRKTLLPGSHAEYVRTGHLVFMAGGSLSAVPFDLERLEVNGDPVGILDDVWHSPSGAGNYALSNSGTLVYLRSTATAVPRALVWIDRKGRETPISAPPRLYREVRLSPDDGRVALSARDEQRDIHVWDLARETLTRLTFHPAVDERPAWTPDGRFIVFGSQRAGGTNVYMQAVDGSGPIRQLTEGTDQQMPAFVTSDGSGIVGTQVPTTTNGDIVWFPLSRPGRAADASSALSRAEPLINSGFVEWNPDVSPDARYLVYQSNESGRDEIYVRPFPRVNEGRWQVSTNGGVQALWSRNGRELFFIDRARRMIAVPVDTTGSPFAFGNPVKLFDAPSGETYLGRDYDVTRDGQRFVMITGSAAGQRAASAAPMVLVLNWLEELKAKAPRAAPR